jgi:hypothetical protein
MSEISQSSQTTISQVLTQSSQLAPASMIARQGVDVLVKHLAGNVLSINKNTILPNNTVLLSNPEIKGKLVENQIHQLKLSLDNPPSLVFFSETSPKSNNVISLTEQQLQSILRLPAKQLIPSSLLKNSDTTNELPLINATILSVLSKEQPATLLSSERFKTHITSSPIQAKNTNLNSQQNILKVILTDLRPPVELSLPVKQLNHFIIGEKVTLALVPKGNNWQLSIIQNKIASQGLPQNAHTHVNLTDTPLSHTANIGVDSAQLSILPPLLAASIIKAALRELNLTRQNFGLPIKAVLQQLIKVNNEQNQGLIQKLQALPIENISLQIKLNGEMNLLVQNSKPVASITVTKEMAQALVPLKLPNQAALIKSIDLPLDTNKPINSPHQAARTAMSQNLININKSNVIVPPVNGNMSPEIKLSMQEIKSNLLAALQEKPLTHTMISQNLLTNKSEQINLVQNLLRIVQPKAQAPSITLQSVEKALVDAEFFKGMTEQPSKQLVEQVLQQIKQALPHGKDQDFNQIRQLFTTPVLNLSVIQMISPTSSQGFMSGLITLLQMSLSARLTRNQSSRAENITERFNNVLSGTSKVKPSVSTKAMNEMAQLEQKHQLIKEIGRLFSDHQTNKLSNAEQMLQGQETFYYNLPSALGGTIKDIELVIKREEDNKGNLSADKQSNKTWQLTMKLTVGELGELLTKAKLKSNTLEINFYASNETVKIQVMNYLPLLRKKLDSLGIEVSKSQCQLGKIPETLLQRPYHMFQAKA